LSFRKPNYVCLARSTARSDEKNNLDAPSAPSLTQLRMPSASSKRLMSGGQAGQIEPIGAGAFVSPTATGARCSMNPLDFLREALRAERDGEAAYF